jgi:hypothetical protein
MSWVVQSIEAVSYQIGTNVRDGRTAVSGPGYRDMLPVPRRL